MDRPFSPALHRQRAAARQQDHHQKRNASAKPRYNGCRCFDGACHETLPRLGDVFARFSFPVYAALDIGDKAPDFTTQAALAGSVYKFSLADSLKKGPVVLYFFPAAYSEVARSKRTISPMQRESSRRSVHRWSASPATTSKRLTKFSVQACQSQFPVASDQTQTVMKSFDAVMQTRARVRQPNLL